MSASGLPPGNRGLPPGNQYGGTGGGGGQYRQQYRTYDHYSTSSSGGSSRAYQSSASSSSSSSGNPGGVVSSHGGQAYTSAAYQYAYPPAYTGGPSLSSSAPIFTCGTSVWKLCLSVLLTTVAIEIVFVLFTGLHLYHGVMYQSREDGAGLPGLGGGWDPETNTTLYPPGPIHINPFRTTTPPTEVEKSVEQFLRDWKGYCQKKVVAIPPGAEGKPLCPCIPRHMCEYPLLFTSSLEHVTLGWPIRNTISMGLNMLLNVRDIYPLYRYFLCL